MVVVLHLLAQEFFSLQFGFEQHREELYLIISELRMPKIKDQVNSGIGSIVPSFMVEGIIKDNAFVLLELFYFISNSHPSSFNSHQWEMHSKFLSRWAIMRCNMAARS
jgi:hypothetical protein